MRLTTPRVPLSGEQELSALSDDIASFRPLDPGRVNAIDPIELQYWCSELKCTESELSEAVARVGEHVAEVRQALASLRGHR
jgi:hypothetical protein